MIIDVHTHLWPPDQTPKEMISYFKKREFGTEISNILSGEGLLSYMKKANIERSIVAPLAFHADADNKELKQYNLYVKEEVKKANEKLIGLCMINPYEGEESIELLRKYIEDWDFQGLKLHPSIQEFYPNNEEIFPIYETMQEYKLPILFHSGSIGIKPFKNKFSRPYLLDDVACEFSELPIILGHSGRIWYEETAMLLRKHENIYADISTNIGRLESNISAPMEWMLSKIKIWSGNLDKVFFGSDYPFYFQEKTLDVLNKAKKGSNLSSHYDDLITKKDIKKITTKNYYEFCKKYDL
ncbi:amidohydrolase family protein [Sporohalobacter salinus]|uniref:amidohydrolase family protein n=1 Tax=Sporohalobacter salinus TaxID=1494606 RepID=UPI0019618D32|nr:amidohydrolase family protein [Sporohalobacter salinus]MBM7623374.1 putative TIM-barrel fold metal-dependent hydrolase [Sporohalobacter salinus]